MLDYLIIVEKMDIIYTNIFYFISVISQFTNCSIKKDSNFFKISSVSQNQRKFKVID